MALLRMPAACARNVQTTLKHPNATPPIHEKNNKNNNKTIRKK